MAQHSDKSRKNKKVVVIEKVRDKYGSVIALKESTEAPTARSGRFTRGGSCPL